MSLIAKDITRGRLSSVTLKTCFQFPKSFFFKSEKCFDAILRPEKYEFSMTLSFAAFYLSPYQLAEFQLSSK